MTNLLLLGGTLLVLAAVIPCWAGDPENLTPIVFATFAGDEHELSNALLMAESIRTFGGAYSKAPIWVYGPAGLAAEHSAAPGKAASLGVEVRAGSAPEDAAWFYYSAKVYAAGLAEAEADGKTAILAWLDEDTIMLQEPGEFILPAAKTLGYRPVMHRNVGVTYGEPLDGFWARVFEKLGVPDSTAFPMVTPADGDTIRPYFNAGCMVVRPGRGLLRKWGDCFSVVYRDSVLTAMCREDVKKRIFIHQVALTGAILAHLEAREMAELSDRFNYPIFFQQMFEAKREFNDITGVVTFRHESYFKKPMPDWHLRLKGPADRISWMREHLAAKASD